MSPPNYCVWTKTIKYRINKHNQGRCNKKKGQTFVFHSYKYRLSSTSTSSSSINFSDMTFIFYGVLVYFHMLRWMYLILNKIRRGYRRQLTIGQYFFSYSVGRDIQKQTCSLMIRLDKRFESFLLLNAGA